MAGFTPNFNLAYFDFNDYLNDPINVNREIDRFILIDKQIYGLYAIFGNGVISGWEVANSSTSEATGISVAVFSGRGIVQSRAGETSITSVVENLPPNSVVYIYAQQTDSSFPSQSSITFTFSNIASISSLVKLAKVTTSDNGIVSVDNTDRDFILIDQQISNAIASHRHRGAPTKIDLDNETKNRLSGAKVESFDGSKISSGRLDLDRIPVLNHNDLTDIGVLTHAQLDTYVNSFSKTNQSILGEVATANRMRQTLYLKLFYPTVDQYFVNELDFLPGVSPDSYYDAINTTATVDPYAHTIAGAPFKNATVYFFTKLFELPDNITKCFIAPNEHNFSDGVISYGISTVNSSDFSTYELLTKNNVNTVSGIGTDMKVGIKIVSPSNLYTHDPYQATFTDYVDFIFENASLSSADFHFRIRFYNDPAMTDLHTSKFSSDDQSFWLINDSVNMPAAGFPVDPGESINVTYRADLTGEFVYGYSYYIAIDIWDGTAFTAGGSGFLFMISNPTSDDKYGNIPRINGFSVLFELENNQKILLNS
jgi:hypothetical protein